MPKPRKSRLRKEGLKSHCDCYYCIGTDYKKWLQKKYNYTLIDIKQTKNN